MPGTTTGTGNPLTFRCSKCKVGREWDSVLTEHVQKGTNVKSTGFRRMRLGGRGPRVDRRYVYEYECLDCGHKGWSRHEQVKRLWERWVANLGKLQR